MSSGTLIPKLKDLYETGLFSDLTITCRGESFRLHKNILWAQSAYFRKLLSGGFKEANTSTQDLDESAAAMKVLFKYFYHFILDDSSKPADESDSSFIIAVYAIADRYDVPRLRTLAAQRFERVCNPGQVDDFVETIRAVDDNTADTTLWNIILPKIRDNLPHLMEAKSFKDLMMDVPTFTFKLVTYLGSGSISATPQQQYRPLEVPEENDDEEMEMDQDQRYWTHNGRGPGRRLG